jgi:hypothetical protein
MVKLGVVAEPIAGPSSSKSIGAFKALVKGFDRITAAPLLLLPSLVLDLLLWLGPHLKINSIVQWLAETIVIPANATPALDEQIRLLRTGVLEIGARFNLLTALSSLPVGIPSLMNARMPTETPLGLPISVDITEPSSVIGIWLVLTTIGLGLGGLYHLWIARRASPGTEIQASWKTWVRILLLAAAAYVTVVVYIFVSVLAASFAALLLSILGVIILFLSFSLLFWLVIYLIFTPHGIVRYEIGLLQAVMESVAIVRWNLMGTMTFVGLAFVVNWLTSQVWLLPSEISWFSLLALLGHAFVSCVLWVGSYVFYQERREWLVVQRGDLTMRDTPNNSPQA